MARRTDAKTKRQEGFSLLEMVVVMAALSTAAILLAPPVNRYLTQTMRDDTLKEMQNLSVAIVAYFEDIGALPQSLDDLREQPGTVPTWQGPYIRSDFSDAVDHSDDFRFDVWLQEYDYTIQAPHLCSLRSLGPNQVDELGGGDDLEIVVSLAPLLRQTTMEELTELNRAVDAYNRQLFPQSPLSGDLATVVSQLQVDGFLPSGTENTERLLSDGWGTPYILVGDPVIHVDSAGAP